MRRAFSLAFLCAAAAVALPACADPSYQFTFSTTGPNGGSFSFDLSPSTPYTPGYANTGFVYSNIAGTVNGQPDTFTEIDFYPTGNGEPVSVTDGSFYQELYFSNFVTGTPDGTPPTFSLGSQTGTVVCSATLRSPFVSTGLPTAMAFLQMQFPFTTTCNEQVTVNVADVTTTTPSSVTPEPASLGLLATGMLGVGGVMRRRFRA